MEHETHDQHLVREVRMGLVFNGGVSLAVWMGGVTHEIDSARRADASDRDGTTQLWHKLLFTILRQSVRVDVIGGASAGGINGAMLATAIATDQPLARLRDTWMEEGSLTRLMRDPLRRNPPSLLQGDEVLLRAIDCTLVEQLSRRDRSAGHPLYLYITATNFYGRSHLYADATGRSFEELDPRHIFSFESIPTYLAPRSPSAGAARGRAQPARWPSRRAGPTSFDDAQVAFRLARAARASSSFPGAFEAAGPLGPADDPDHFIDGGVLDNQPFGPVLDRLAVMPATEIAVKRVVGYIVPYVNEPASAKQGATGKPAPRARPPTALGTVGASFKLPRELPKLQSLDRVTAEQEAERSDQALRKRIAASIRNANLANALHVSATALFPTYQETRRHATEETFLRWCAPSFVPGSGRLGQATTIAVSAIAPGEPASSSSTTTPRVWVPDVLEWPDRERIWRWGLSPAERIATWALLSARDQLEPEERIKPLIEARSAASRLVWDIRTLKQHLSENFASPRDSGATPAARAEASYQELRSPIAPDQPALEWLQEQFVALDTLIEDIPHARRIPSIQTLLNYEVARNALTIETEGPPFPFNFVFMSAGIQNSLGHPAATPDEKLAGMKVGHFGGFVKSSWRANDWMWGRIDGVEHILRATFDREYLATLSAGNAATLASELSAFAFAGQPELTALVSQWEESAALLSRPLAKGSTAERFAEALDRAAHGDASALELCRAALAARIQLAILAEELEHVAAAARTDETSWWAPDASSTRWMREHAVDRGTEAAELIASFRAMRVGAEPIGPELLSRAGYQLLAQALELTKAVLAGDRGGVPARMRFPIRLLLSSPIRALIRWRARKALSD